MATSNTSVNLPPVIGEVQSVTGRVVAIGLDGAERQLVPGDPVHADDVIRTIGVSTVAVSLNDGGIEFWGGSFVCDPFGVVLAEAGMGEEVLVVECDLSRQEEVRRGWPFLRDRRIDAYGGIVKRLIEGE